MLVCDVDTDVDTCHLADSIRYCARSFCAVWLLVISKQGGASRSAWRTAQAVLAATASCASIKLRVRVASWGSCWQALQPMLPTAPPRHNDNGISPRGDDEESQHEAILVLCGLNAASALRVVRGTGLRAFLALSPAERRGPPRSCRDHAEIMPRSCRDPFACAASSAASE